MYIHNIKTLRAYPNTRGVGTGFQRTGFQRTEFQKNGFLVFLFGFKSPEGDLKPNIFVGGAPAPPPHPPTFFVGLRPPRFSHGKSIFSWKTDFLMEIDFLMENLKRRAPEFGSKSAPSKVDLVNYGAICCQIGSHPMDFPPHGFWIFGEAAGAADKNQDWTPRPNIQAA